MKFVALAIATLALTLVAHADPEHGGFDRDHDHGGFDHDHDGDGGGFHRGGGWGGGVWYPTYPSYPGSSYPGSCGWDGFCHDTYVSSGTVECAPKQVEGNVAVTEKTLNALAATSAFATAKTFKSELSQVAAIKNAGEKAQAYLQLAGINSSDKAAVAAFIGSRDAKGSWVTDLQRNADLTNAQAEIVALKLQTALRGNLQ